MNTSKPARTYPRRLFLVASFILFSLVFGGHTVPAANIAPQVSQSAPAEPSPSQVDALLAGLSDEQVRQMLINELKKESLQEGTLEANHVPGPGAILGKLLRHLNQESDEQESQLKLFLGGIPHVLPDLYKVFITL